MKSEEIANLMLRDAYTLEEIWEEANDIGFGLITRYKKTERIMNSLIKNQNKEVKKACAYIVREYMTDEFRDELFNSLEEKGVQA